jgi:hypothetical protein
LIGGSGGAGSTSGGYPGGGGGGGGAILIACGQTISLLGPNGSFTVRGGSWAAYGGGGSGGAVRVVSDAVTGNLTSLLATGGSAQYSGGSGRIRLECNTLTPNPPGSMSVPAYTYGAITNGTPDVWPPVATPSLRVTHVGGLPVPADPQASLAGPGDLQLISQQAVEVLLDATDMPTDGTWQVKVRAVPIVGAEQSQTATMLPGGTPGYSTWKVTFPALPVAMCSGIQARAAVVQ